MHASVSRYAGLGLALTLLGCGGGGPTKLGAVLPLSGTASVYGQAIRKGIDLAAEEVNKDPKGPRIEVLIADSGSDPARARKELGRVYDSGASAAIGGVTSAEALAMVEVADDQNRILLSPSASLPQLSGISSNFFRIFPSDFSEGTVMARYAFENLNLRTGVILAKQETYAKGIQQVFTEEFQRKGGKILEVIEFPASGGELGALTERAAMLKPDFVYLAAYAEEVSSMIRDLRARQYPGIILTTSSIAAATTIAKTGEAAEGAYFTQTSFDIEGAKTPDNVKAFVEAFRARYREAPDLYAAHGYDAVRVLVEAIRQGADSPSAFWKGMRSVHEFPGVTGTLQFDDKGDVAKFPHVYIVSGGKALDVEAERQRQIELARKRMQELEDQLRRLQNAGDK
ncbi:MAG: ABC transporter substrate-binding protein [Thermoanaerobaculia bacterium]|nr:MAG: ABC transporter substrate-binding protein [Thermoanaerobaculia bacterium]